ncbi:hypothetical protein Pelo_8902 [Pelomyxa schiedti]|nr:hypothetical protein Pelo_8902 [Pelomyxa schiedti]
MPGISSWMSSLLQELHLAFMCDEVPHLSFCLLPDSRITGTHFVPERLMTSVWGLSRKFNISNDKIVVTGRSFRFENIHEGMLTQLMNMARQIPGVQPEVFWKTGLWVSKKCEGGKQDLLITEQAGESINMFMRTSFSSSVESHDSLSFGVNLGAHVLMWLNRFFQVNNLPAVQSFPCPHCLMNKIRVEGEEVNYFQEDVLKAALDQTSDLKCPRGEERDPRMTLTDIAPELSYLTIGPPSTDSGNILIYEGENVPVALETILPMISVLREIPRRKLVNYTGARVVEQKSLQSCLRGTSLNLRDLLMKSSTEVSSFIGSILTMSLRQKILRDVAKGLEHLHSQHPPLVHDGLFLEDGSLTLFSHRNQQLSQQDAFGSHRFRNQEEQPDLGQSLDSLDALHRKVRTRPLKSKNTNNDESMPGPIIRTCGSDPKTDVWNFGVLVRQVVDPLNPLQRVRVTSGHPAGRFHAHPHPSARLPWPQPHTIAVEPQRLATVAAVKTGCSIVPIFRKSAPRWAKALMTLCWTVNPASRPSMCNLLNAWDYFGDCMF